MVIKTFKWILLFPLTDRWSKCVVVSEISVETENSCFTTSRRRFAELVLLLLLIFSHLNNIQSDVSPTWEKSSERVKRYLRQRPFADWGSTTRFLIGRASLDTSEDIRFISASWWKISSLSVFFAFRLSPSLWSSLLPLPLILSDDLLASPVLLLLLLLLLFLLLFLPQRRAANTPQRAVNDPQKHNNKRLLLICIFNGDSWTNYIFMDYKIRRGRRGEEGEAWCH